jgi:cytoskeletal protein CcmA (bactofilin family)
VEGNIHAERQVLVSKGGEVKGDIHSKEVIVGGRVEGSVRATGRVEVQSTATVDGDILTKRILVHEGGEVNGVLRMGDADVAEGTLASATGAAKNQQSAQQSTPTAK